MSAPYLDEVMKEACDLVYVVLGMFVEFGWDFDEAFARVHESNMSKLGEDGKPIYREDGKVLKGPDFFKPDLTDLL
jgi:predicted HAD superfamily Cof-like phosphohydrolase